MRSQLVLLIKRLKHSGFRKAAQKGEPGANAVSRGSQIALMHRRLAQYERQQKNEAMQQAQSEFMTDSIVAENFLRNAGGYEKVLERRAIEQESAPLPSTSTGACELPLAAKPLAVSALRNEDLVKTGDVETSEENSVDRGYFVEGDVYLDDYIMGRTTDLPDDELTMSYRQVFGPEDALEHIDFQLPGQRTDQSSDTDIADFGETYGEELEQVGSVNPMRAAINKNCSGCGAQLHCKDASLPGFLPEELLDKAASKKASLEAILCRRCHLLKHHNFLLNVNVCPVDYESVMSCLRMNPEALVLLVVDVTDIPGSIHRQLPRIIGPRRPMIVIANKVDLLPPDAQCGYLKRFKNVVEEAIQEAGFLDQFAILHTALVSAKTGYGIEDLITQIHLKYTNLKQGVRNDIYLVGCTNAGKSSLFNALLQSDLCKVRAIDLVERATISVWPGTTLSLLKFPIMKPTPFRLELRRRRLLQHRAWLQKEMYRRKIMLQETGDPKYAVLMGTIQNTYKEREDEQPPIAINRITGGVTEEDSEPSKGWSMRDPVFAKGMWCYDTPGTVNDQQVLNLFTLDELIHVLPRRLLQPRTALVPVGYSLLIGGVARLDVVESVKESRVLLTTFVSDDIPLNCIPTSEVKSFLQENLGTKALVVPCGKEERMAQWPAMESRNFEFKGKKEGGAVADIVLSSIGWVMLTSACPFIKIRAYTPDGRGLATRSPMLPHAAELRGKRIPGTRFYKVKPVEFPVNERRVKARSYVTTLKSKMDLRCKTNELLERHPWLKPAAYLSTFIVVLICFGFEAFSIACCLCSLFLGASIAAWIANDSNGRFLYPLVQVWFSSQFNEKGRKSSDGDVTSQKRRVVPWKELEVPASVNDALESLLDQIIDEYVNNWYESEISRDRAFINEIRYQIRFACSKILMKALALDLPAVVAEDFLPTIALHMHRIIEMENEVSEKAYPRSLIESHICEKLADLHYCMGSRKNELDYLKQIADFLITKFVDDTHLAGRAHDDDSPSRMAGNGRNMSAWPSQSARHFLRELTVNAILLPCLDLIADPDTINHLLILAFDAQKAREEEVSQVDNRSNHVTLLTNFTEPTSQTVPDSLLQLKLSELLRDARQFSMFRLYLQDTRGPVHELSFLAEASRIHDSMQKKTESSSQIAYDIWQLFGQFVHDSAPERIEFDEEIVNEFKAAVECNNLLLLDKIIERSYQVVYQRMQTDHVVPFCQSDAFLGYLCGSPPVCVNELIDQRSVSRKPSVAGETFSLAQFRLKLRRAIAGVSSDSLESEPSVGSSFEGVDLSVESAASDNGKELPMDRKSSTSSLASRSLSQLSLPSIDVSVIGDVGNVSPASGCSGTDEDDVSSSSAVEPPSAEPVLVIDKETRNINQWKVNISKIVPMRDSTTGRTVYVYVIDVERKEAKEKETKCWSIFRRFAEFYVLEMKLLEFHGDSLRFTLLPPRKTLVSRNRAFLEQHRLLFSLFLSSLCKQNMLQRSDLLFAFLTSSEEFRQNILLSDLNPWKVVKKMPGKLSREKGQHIRPFLLTVLANTLYTREKVEFKDKFEASETSSLSSMSVGGEQYPTSLYNPLFGNNCCGCKIAEAVESNCKQNWSRSFTDGISLLFFSIMSHTSHWTLNVHSALRMLCRNTIDYLMLHLLKRLYWTVFSEVNLVTITQLIQSAIFCSDGSLPSDQEKSLREELATRRALEFAQEEMPSCVLRVLDSKSWRGGVKRLVNTLQYPRLNKHLSYLLLDLLVTKLFPEDLT
ncbi:hypothetical protein GCK32_003331 [Trichostrongylus colubriformis]|uniref:Uncharacterized protein n=1 Tax=Trichostrongylus colubriformis TaxID=6319 RepID=A0AAN8G807_TRICO